MYAALFLYFLCLCQAIPQKTRPKKCALGVHVIAVRGHGTSNPPYGLSTTTVNNITAAIPYSDVVPVNYPADDQFFTAAEEGAAATKKYIMKYVKSCPDSKIVVQGYSQGAVAVMQALCGGSLHGQTPDVPLSDSYAENIVAIVTYGDETRNADAPYNVGTCTNDAPYARASYECGAFTSSIRSWCDSIDPECCRGGTNESSHYQYPDEYNQALTDYVVQQYDASQGQ